MIPLVDMHCHLLAGLDDGPQTDEDALAMCALAYEDGTRIAAATAHQNESWPAVTPERIRQATARLAQQLRDARIPLTVFPCAEVMARPDADACWRRGELLSVADRGQYLLLEMPHNLFVDLGGLVEDLRRDGVRPILAHPERHPELLHEPDRLAELVRAGCLVQVSAGSVTAPAGRRDGRALRSWFLRGLVHLLGSDGHSPRRRRPGLAEAYHTIARWAGSPAADRVCSTHGTVIAHGLPLHVPRPIPKRTWWIPKLW
jgi:protein-tyrosine phosphatase